MSLLTSIETGLKKFFGVAIKAAEVAEPFVDIAFPGIATLYNLTVAEAGKAETAAIAAGAQSGTGAQKLAMVLQAIEPDIQATLAANGYEPATQEQLAAWINAAVAGLAAFTRKP